MARFGQLLQSCFEKYELGFLTDMVDQYRLSPLVLKFGLLELFREGVFSGRVVIGFVLRRLFGDAEGIAAVLLEVLGEILETCQSKAEQLELDELKVSLFGEVLKPGVENSLLHQKILEFVFSQ